MTREEWHPTRAHKVWLGWWPWAIGCPFFVIAAAIGAPPWLCWSVFCVLISLIAVQQQRVVAKKVGRRRAALRVLAARWDGPHPVISVVGAGRSHNRVTLGPERIANLERREDGLLVELFSVPRNREYYWIGEGLEDWRSLAERLEQAWWDWQEAQPELVETLPPETVCDWLGIAPNGVYQAGWSLPMILANASGILVLSLSPPVPQSYPWADLIGIEPTDQGWRVLTVSTSFHVGRKRPETERLVEVIRKVLAAREEGHLIPRPSGISPAAISRMRGEPEAPAELGLSRMADEER